MSHPSIFITGGSGYIGSRIVEFAIADGYAVTALSRSEASDTKLSDLGATPVRGDLTTLDVLTREAAKADVVISMADSIAGNYGMSQDERIRINSKYHHERLLMPAGQGISMNRWWYVRP